jgi:hypothetical protein
MRFLVFISVFYFQFSLATIHAKVIQVQDLTINMMIYNHVASIARVLISKNPKLFLNQKIVHYESFEDFEFLLDQKMSTLSTLISEIKEGLIPNHLNESESAPLSEEEPIFSIDTHTKIAFFNKDILSCFEVFNQIRKLHPHLEELIPFISIDDTPVVSIKKILQHSNSMILSAFRDINRYHFSQGPRFIKEKNLKEIQEDKEALTLQLETQVHVLGVLEQLLKDYEDTTQGLDQTSLANIANYIGMFGDDFKDPAEIPKKTNLNTIYNFLRDSNVVDLINSLAFTNTRASNIHSRLYPQ